jgi:hypothetical protein
MGAAAPQRERFGPTDDSGMGQGRRQSSGRKKIGKIAPDVLNSPARSSHHFSDCKRRDLSITVGDDVAFSSSLTHHGGVGPDGEKIEFS